MKQGVVKMKNLGIIGGSGLYNLAGIEVCKEHSVDTPYGDPSGPIVEFKSTSSDQNFFFIARHGKDHHLTPTEVNYRANIFALKKLGVEFLVSVSAVGSLKEELKPETFFLPDQFIDWTKGQRKRSFFEKGIVGHVSVARPVNEKLQNMLWNELRSLEITSSKNGSYICIEGPQFSSKAESEIYRSFGASVIGMTNVPEAYLAKEAGMAFATVAMVTDYDCWKEEHCTVEEIMKVMKSNNKSANILISRFIDNFKPIDFLKENKIGVMTPDKSLSGENKKILEVLLS